MLLTEELPKKPLPTADDLRVVCVSDDEQCVRLRDDWNRLAGDVPFRRWEWLEAWWRHFRRPGDRLCLLCVYDSSQRLVGLAPWYVGSSILFGDVIRFLGSGVVCSDYLTILSADGLEETVARRVADWMTEEANVRWDALELNGLAADDTAVAAFMERLAARGCAAHRTAGLSCWRIALPDCWEEYLLALSKSRRERVRQLQRRKFDSGQAIAKVVESPTDLERGFGVLVDLHQRRRKSLGQPGCFSVPGFAGFLREAAERFLKLGRLRLQWIELNERPVAVQLDLAGGQTVYHYQSGIDPQFPRERPGWMGISAALKSSIQQGFCCYDFLRGDEKYKSHWRAEPVDTSDVRIAGQSATARLRYELWIRRQRLKNWIKRRLSDEE